MLELGPGAQIFFSQQAAEANHPGEGYYLHQYQVQLKGGTMQTRWQWVANARNWYQIIEDRLAVLEAKKI